MTNIETRDLDQLLETAIHAARAGGDVLNRYLREGVSIRDKSGQGGKTYDLVSDADLESERTIAEFIRLRYPDHDLLGEEALSLVNTNVPDLWIIDPLDGTNNLRIGFHISPFRLRTIIEVLRRSLRC